MVSLPRLPTTPSRMRLTLTRARFSCEAGGGGAERGARERGDRAERDSGGAGDGGAGGAAERG